MTREQWGYLVWGILFAFVAVTEILAAAFGKTMPFPTLSTTIRNLIVVTDGWAAIAIVGGFAILLVHWIIPDAFNPKKRRERRERRE